MDSGFGNSIYWTLPPVTIIIHLTTHKPETCLLRPVSLQASYFLSYSVTFLCLNLSLSLSLSLCVSSVSHPLKTVLRELNRAHLIEGLGCLAND
jgi:hypothetical protein